MKISKFIFSIFILSLISSIVFTGCQQEEELDKSNRNEIYLSLPFNADFNKLTNEDREIIFQAFSRLDIKENEDGLFEILQNAGKDANISEELFKYFQLIAYNSNEKILSENYFSRNRIQTRTEIGNTRTDCVARSIAYAAGQSFDEVNSWITKTYGSNGVPSDKFYFAMNHFCDDGGMIGLSMFHNMNIDSNSRNKYVIVINAVHAVNLEYKSGSSIMYYDAQNGVRGFCTLPNVTHVYEIR